MRIIKIAENDLGYHESLFYRDEKIPEGWALIPAGTVYPDSFPFVHLTVDGGVVTAMEAVTLPAPTPAPSPAPENPEADMMEMALDHEVRMIQLELGITTAK